MISGKKPSQEGDLTVSVKISCHFEFNSTLQLFHNIVDGFIAFTGDEQIIDVAIQGLFLQTIRVPSHRARGHRASSAASQGDLKPVQSLLQAHVPSVAISVPHTIRQLDNNVTVFGKSKQEGSGNIKAMFCHFCLLDPAQNRNVLKASAELVAAEIAPCAKSQATTTLVSEGPLGSLRALLNSKQPKQARSTSQSGFHALLHARSLRLRPTAWRFSFVSDPHAKSRYQRQATQEHAVQRNMPSQANIKDMTSYQLLSPSTRRTVKEKPKRAFAVLLLLVVTVRPCLRRSLGLVFLECSCLLHPSYQPL